MEYWEFKNGITVEGDGSAVFSVNLDGDFLGHIVCGDYADYKNCTAELNSGIDPITGGWEDGNGNPCTLSGWGNSEELKRSKKGSADWSWFSFFLRAILNCWAVRVPLCIGYIA